MSSSNERSNSLCTFESTFVHASILGLTTELSISWVWTCKIIVLFLKETVLTLLVLWWVKSIDVWWQTLHRRWIYTLRHSVHMMSSLLFYREWCRKLIIIYSMRNFRVFIWFHVLLVRWHRSYRNSIVVVNIKLVPLLSTLQFQTLTFINKRSVIAIRAAYLLAMFTGLF